MMIGIGLGITGNIVLSPPAPPEDPGETFGPELSTSAGSGAWAGTGWSESAPFRLTSQGDTTVTNGAGEAVEQSATYRVVWELISRAGGLGDGAAAEIGGTRGPLRPVPGVYEETIIAASTGKPAFHCDDEDGCVIGNWSFKKDLSS